MHEEPYLFVRPLGVGVSRSRAQSEALVELYAHQLEHGMLRLHERPQQWGAPHT